MRRLGLCLCILASLAAAPFARADGLLVGAVQGGPGVLSPDGTLRYVALPAGDDTVIEAASAKDGSPTAFSNLLGSWGIPMIGVNGLAGGVSHDGKTLVVGGTDFNSPSRFLVLRTRDLRVRNGLSLKGRFGFDALSPDGRMLYLIQTLSLADASRYVVRAYDLRRNRLLPGRIADRTQKSWVMQGYPETRTTSADGRWVFTLYQNPGGYPFVHALDTVRGVAHCVGLPFTGDQSVLFNLRLDLRDGGRTLAVHWRSGRPWLDVSVGSWRISYPGGGFPWAWAGGGIGAGLALLTAATLLLRRRRLHEEVEQHPREQLGIA